MKNIAIIGMGHLGKALFKGLINSKEIKLILNTEIKSFESCQIFLSQFVKE